MTRARVLGAAAVAIAAIGGAAWWTLRQPPVPADRPAAVAGTAGPGLLTAMPIGIPPRGEERPQITHVAIADLDRDGLNDVLVCDALKNQVAWIRQAPRGTFTEQTIAGVSAPAHVEAIDFDGDGDTDLLVAALGFLFPNNSPVGSVIVMENDGRQRFRSHYVADRVARVADARAADFDADGDLDISVAGFGYDDGETSWLENQGGWKFQQHVLQRLAGGINAVPADINRDGAQDIVHLDVLDARRGAAALPLVVADALLGPRHGDVEEAPRPVALGVGRAEQGDDRGAHGAGDVQRAGVAGNHQLGASRQSDQVGNPGGR